MSNKWYGLENLLGSSVDDFWALLDFYPCLFADALIFSGTLYSVCGVKCLSRDLINPSLGNFTPFFCG